MPIILDESFAFIDNYRLENVLNYLNEKYTEKQIIIFSCTNKEKAILENKRIEYKYIEL